MKKALLAATASLGCALVGGGHPRDAVAAEGGAVEGIALADEPSLIGGGIGWFDGLRTDARDEAVAFRFDFRWGRSLLPMLHPHAFLRPWIGIDATSDGSVFGAVGLLLDVPVGPVVVTPGAGVGYYEPGGGKDLGNGLEFRTAVELAYRFADATRVSVALAHISNADLGDRNPGAEILSIHYYLPVTAVFGP